MTTTPPEAPSSAGDPGGQDGPRVTRDEVRDLGRLRRSAYDRKVAGVAGGLARHLDIDPIILRVAFVVLSFFGGAGLIVYGACWLLVPDERTHSATVNLDERSRTFALWIVGLVAALAMLGDSVGGWGFPWPLAVVGLVVLAVVMSRGERPAPATFYGAPSGPGAPVDPAGSSTATVPPAYAPPSHPVYVPLPVPPRHPRRRGPLLFWFTLALIAVAEGVLATVDLAGASVSDSSYPALALGIIGVMLLLGAFYGRAGGLIALGLLAAVATAGTTAAGEIDSGRIVESPRTVAQLDDRYELGAGEIVLDLRRLDDPGALDGLTLHLESTFGRIEVIVPDGVDVDADATVDGLGHSALFGDDRDGSDRHFHEGGDDAPLLQIEADVTFGEIVVDTQRSPR
ncbi:PspC domain-containing protein [Nocardioides sp. 503]|uniref:PspC domain-containing protein n=1 Tax=Nocardioides sp. 503 TaxID=2508326 RepID=UPI00142FDC9A|nr:PspC domain-containing protein [Nocardioides sp. 503]